MESPIYVKCLCHNCGHEWESNTSILKCPKCGSDVVSQRTMLKGL